MVNDRQVRLLRKKRMENKTLEAAASAAGMSIIADPLGAVVSLSEPGMPAA